MRTNDHAHEHQHDQNIFTLFVSHSDREAAVNQVMNAICTGGCFCPFQLVVCDVEKQPDLAREAHIDHTPILVRQCSGTRQCLDGDHLCQCEEVKAFLHAH